jgi:hypothetical protein
VTRSELKRLKASLRARSFKALFALATVPLCINIMRLKYVRLLTDQRSTLAGVVTVAGWNFSAFGRAPRETTLRERVNLQNRKSRRVNNHIAYQQLQERVQDIRILSYLHNTLEMAEHAASKVTQGALEYVFIYPAVMFVLN